MGKCYELDGRINISVTVVMNFGGYILNSELFGTET